MREETEEAVVLLDALARIGRIDLESLGDYLAKRSGHVGCRKATRAFSLADGRAESPQESRLRIRLQLNALLGNGWLVHHVTAPRYAADV